MKKTIFLTFFLFALYLLPTRVLAQTGPGQGYEWAPLGGAWGTSFDHTVSRSEVKEEEKKKMTLEGSVGLWPEETKTNFFEGLFGSRVFKLRHIYDLWAYQTWPWGFRMPKEANTTPEEKFHPEPRQGVVVYGAYDETSGERIQTTEGTYAYFDVGPKEGAGIERTGEEFTKWFNPPGTIIPVSHAIESVEAEREKAMDAAEAGAKNAVGLKGTTVEEVDRGENTISIESGKFGWKEKWEWMLDEIEEIWKRIFVGWFFEDLICFQPRILSPTARTPERTYQGRGHQQYLLPPSDVEELRKMEEKHSDPGDWEAPNPEDGVQKGRAIHGVGDETHHVETSPAGDGHTEPTDFFGLGGVVKAEQKIQEYLAPHVGWYREKETLLPVTDPEELSLPADVDVNPDIVSDLTWEGHQIDLERAVEASSQFLARFPRSPINTASNRDELVRRAIEKAKEYNISPAFFWGNAAEESYIGQWYVDHSVQEALRCHNVTGNTPDGHNYKYFPSWEAAIDFWHRYIRVKYFNPETSFTGEAMLTLWEMEPIYGGMCPECSYWNGHHWVHNVHNQMAIWWNIYNKLGK